MALSASSSYKEAEIAEIQAELNRIREGRMPGKGGTIRVTGRNFRSGIEVTVGNDGDGIYVNIRNDKRTAGILLSRGEFAVGLDNTAVFKNAIRKATTEIIKYSPKK